MSRQSPGRSRTARFTYTAVRSEGGLLPYELLEAIGNLEPALGITPAAYFLAEHEPLAEAQSRAWLRLVGLWRAFQGARQKLPEGDPAVRLTRERWLLPLFAELGYGRLKTAAAIVVDGRELAVSHALGPVPIHLMGAGVDLDKPTAGIAGAARVSPHGLVQDLLNRSDDHLWGVVTNGLRLRVLRDFHSLTRQAFLDFDLEAIFEGERFADFRLLWLVVHASRLGPAEATPDKPESAAIEAWFQKAKGEGIRALDRLREGVQKAIERLGAGFLRGPGGNPALHEALRSGRLGTQEYYRQLLRLVYRLIFVFVAEDRDVLLPELPADADKGVKAAQERYRAYYATTRVRELALRRRGGPHGDLWQALRLVLGKLYAGCPELGLPALGSYLWSPEATADLAAAELANQDLLGALRALCTFEEGGIRRLVSWRSIGADELGSVYESFLELHPEIHREAAAFSLRSAAGNERKTTGSYYTPSSLVECLLDSALDPVLDRAAAQKDAAAAEAAILGLRVCDPACGSGHFLVAAGRRIAHRLAQVRAGETEPSPELMRHALRDVYARCLFGVDINPMAVELCKVSLWMEAIEPGRPLPFLDAHVLQGNALLGATPALMRVGIPDEAFKEIEGDDKEVAKRLRQRNRKGQQGGMFDGGGAGVSADAPRWTPELSRRAKAMEAEGDESLADIERRARRYGEYVGSEDYQSAKLLADAWCAAFVWPKDVEHEEAAPTHLLFRAMSGDPGRTPAKTRETVRELAEEYGFFHWYLAFPQVFQVGGEEEQSENPKCGWSGGFDVVLGNPPWERIKLEEREYFANRAPEISAIKKAYDRKKALVVLRDEDPSLWAEWTCAVRRSTAESWFIRASASYPLCGRGDINTYAIFAELNWRLTTDTGRLGCIVPSGIATDPTNQLFFQSIVETSSLRSFFDFQSGPGLFQAIGHGTFKFCLLTIGPPLKGEDPAAEFSFFLRRTEHLADPSRRFQLSRKDISLINPNTRTCPVFRSRRDAVLTREIHARVPPLARDGAAPTWPLTFRRVFDMTNDSASFLDRNDLVLWTMRGNLQLSASGDVAVPLYEAKMMHQFSHRFGDYSTRSDDSESSALPAIEVHRLGDPCHLVTPKYWVRARELNPRTPESSTSWAMGWRDITKSQNERTAIAAIIPHLAAGNTLHLVLCPADVATKIHALCANLNAFVLDYVVRQKIGGTHLTHGVMNQLPILPPSTYASPTPWHPTASLADWIRPRVLELTYTAWDLAAFARDHGYAGPPFRWDEERRFWLRAELDAAYFHLYGLAPADIAHVMDSFWLVRQRDEKQHGTFRTKDAILDLYARMAGAIAGGEPFETVLDPPPADPRIAHPPLSPEEAERLRPILRLGPFNGPEAAPAEDDETHPAAPAKARPPASKRTKGKSRNAEDDAPLFAQLDPGGPALADTDDDDDHADTTAETRRRRSARQAEGDDHEAPAPRPARTRRTSTKAASPPSALAGDQEAFQLIAPPAAPLRLPLDPPPSAAPEPNPPTARTTTGHPETATEHLPSTTHHPSKPPHHSTTPLPDDPEPIRHLLATQDPDVTPEVVGVLRALYRASEPLTKGELLDQAGIDPGKWSGTIKTLLEAGLVDKEGVKRGTRYRLA